MRQVCFLPCLFLTSSEALQIRKSSGFHPNEATSSRSRSEPGILESVLVTSVLVTGHMFTFHRNHREASAKNHIVLPCKIKWCPWHFHNTQSHLLETCNSGGGSGQLTRAVLLSMGGKTEMASTNTILYKSSNLILRQ